MNRILLPLMLIVVGGCNPDAPASPRFQQDVLPVLAANCVSCHGVPALGGAPELIVPQTKARFPSHRFDVYGDVTVREALLPATVPLCVVANRDERCSPIVVAGASSLADDAARRAADDDAPMPPRFRLDDHQIELLENWADQGAERGEPRAGNARPSAVIDTTERTGDIIRLSVDVDDADRDPVGGSLHVQIGGTETFVGLLQSGITSVTWDATGLAGGPYPLSARLDDGAAEVVINLGMVTVGGL